MNRNKRLQLLKKRSDTNQSVQQKIQTLRNKGYSQNKARGQQVDGEDIDVLLDYIQLLVKRIEILESALNLDIDPK